MTPSMVRNSMTTSLRMAGMLLSHSRGVLEGN
jgi:hypothetical protein